MEIRELINLCIWFDTYGRPVVGQLRVLHKKLNQNATQPTKQPVKDDLKLLLGSLRAMPLHLLTREQISVLEREDVLQFVGNQGARHIESIVKSARFDAATAAQEISEIQQALGKLQNNFSEVADRLASLKFVEEEESYIDQIAVRVHFRDNAAINDITELKEWSQEWFDIMRGIAICVDEAPETVKVLGAHQGSVILVLGTTATATALLLLISNHVTKIGLNALELANAVEDFKHKVKLNKSVMKGLEKSIEDLEQDGLKELLDAAVETLPKPYDGEKVNALKKSIEKMNKFTKKGGEVDILPPPDPEDGEYDPPLSKDEIEDARNVRKNHDELRNTREQIRLLADQSEDEIEFDDEDLEDNDPEQ